MLDNASFHHSKYIREKFEKFDIPVHYLGPYSYDAAPVEKVFSVIKRLRRLSSAVKQGASANAGLNSASNIASIESLTKKSRV